jgi:D-sedoheptulose 7-phosphate isomerase
MQNMIKDELNSHLDTIKATINRSEPILLQICEKAIQTLKNGNKILLCGNGGSAADAQHIAAELTGRYKSNRKGLASIALTTDTSALSAISNDFGYDMVFSRQVEALANKGDMLIGISTSGNSQNIINALKLANQLDCTTIGLSGNDGGDMNKICDINLVVASNNTPRIQEMHILFGHIICQAIDNAFEV